MEIRSAVPADAGELSALIGELGYPGDPQQLRRTLVDLDGAAADAVLLAVDGQRLLGCISLHALPLFHRAGRLGRITAFVVASGQRGRGTGSALLASAHEWFGSAGCVKFEVTTGDHREAAHRFYQQHGYVRDGQRLARSASL